MIEFEIEDGVLYKCNDGYHQHNHEIVIPDGVRVIKSKALHLCYTVRVVIPESVEEIEDEAFYLCRVCEVENNSKIVFPTDPEALRRAFGYLPLGFCRAGESRLVTDSEGFVFYPSEGEARTLLVDYVGEGGDIRLPESFGGEPYDIYESAFRYLESPSAVTVPEGIEVIGACAFENCESLRSVTLLGAREIGFSAFAECGVLSEVRLNDGLLKIGGQAFWYCEELRELHIPASVEVIGGSILQYCEKLTSLSVPVCRVDVRDTDTERFYIGKLFGARNLLIQSADKRPPYCLKELTVYGDVPEWSFVTAYGLRRLTVKGRVIGEYAFHDLSNLESVVLEGVEQIGRMAFSKCSSLIHLAIPKGAEVAVDAFAECPLLN